MDESPRTERKEGDAYCCPVCGYPTLSERGGYDICALCNWEDELVDDVDTATGPNRDYTIREARENFRQHLTMYRAGDEPRFTETRGTDHLKKVFMALIDAYRVERGSGSLSFHRNARARVLWKGARFVHRYL
jgi:uncharacterized Zn finger protein (UPF0148 family)